jgi:light-regulated signal transduction histidine kinase (bacteriophytochrome)
MSDGPIVPTDLVECASERIHIPGSIQPHGFLFVLDPSNLSVLAASGNVATATGLVLSEIVGCPVTDLLVSANAKDLTDALQAGHDRGSLRVRFLKSETDADWDGIVHNGDAATLFELWPRLVGDPEDLLAAVQRGSDRIRKCDTPENACAILAHEIRRLSGFDRVMVYRFDAEWNGEVVAEDRAPFSLSYLGHSFPAGDIPAQARALYLRNPVRLIPDSAYVPSPIVPSLLAFTGEPIDLSMVALRSVSPVHLEYLANMGVGASMSISIIKDGKLWGLVACHHANPRVLSSSHLQSFEMLTQALAWYLTAHESSAATACVEATRRLETHAGAQTAVSQDFLGKLGAIAPGVLDITKSQGLAFCDGQSVWTAGSTPVHEDILALSVWLSKSGKERFETAGLSDEYPQASRYQDIASGLAARRLPGGWLLWFRSEWPHTLTWAGDPEQVARAKSGGGRISPRASFASWRKSVTGKSRPWSAIDIYAIEEAKILAMRYLMTDQLQRLTESETALHAAKIRADESNKSKSDFLAGMSHELRTPLNAILGLSEIIENKMFGPVSAKYAEYAHDIHRSGRHLLALIDDILDLAKIDAGQMELRERNFTLRTAIDDCLEMIRGQADSGQVSLVVDQPVRALSMFADERRIRQLLLNLLSNAVKFTLPGGSVTVRAVVDEDGRVDLSVQDMGVGMTPSEIEIAVSPFGQIARNQARNAEGTGLGLTICKSLTEMHGGDFQITSTPNQGTTVRLLFPAARTVSHGKKRYA